MKDMKKTIQIKKLLICMLALVLVITGVLVYRWYQFHTDDKAAISTNTPEPSVSSAPLASTDPLLTPGYAVAAYAPIEPDNTTGFATGWYTNTTDGDVTADMGYEDKNITIHSAGTAFGSASLYRDGIPYVTGTSYTVNFTVTSSISRTIQVQAINVDTGEVLGSTTVNVGTDAVSGSLVFTMNSTSTYNGRLLFSIGNDGSADVSSEHTILFTGIRILPSTWVTDVKTNQVSYFTDAEKRCTFSYDAGDVFDVVNTETGAVVYSGAIVNKKKTDTTGETECYGDFTNVTEPGTYAVHSQIGTSSYTFSIGNQTYSLLNTSLLHMISLQRCGQDLDSSWAGNLAHAQCHTEQATIYGTDEKIDVSGGWHDAGDYGRYIKTGAKTVNDLLFAYMSNPNVYTDDTSGPDSGNGIADILDEARYELEWMLKMQDSSDGGVYNKVLTTNLPGTILPNEDIQDLWVLEKETTATADFAGSMAIASLAWQDIDPDFANTCLKAAEQAYSYLKSNPDLHDAANPDGINGGSYIESSDADGRFTAAIALYVITDDSSYLDDAKSYYASDSNAADGLYWNTNGGYGRYLYLIKCSKDTDPDFYQQMMDSLTAEASEVLSIANGNSYNSSLTAYTWGSNGILCDNGILMSMYYDLTGDQTYLQSAYEQLNYILGRNSLNMSFVSGFGTYSPADVHSRIAVASNTTLLGALVGGPDASRDDPVTQAMADTVPAAKMYSDSYDSYSTNEITVYWNSSLIHLISKLDQ